MKAILVTPGNRSALVAALKEISKAKNDPEGAYEFAVDALLEFVGDRQITDLMANVAELRFL